jgi:hypothetical protein
MLPFNILYKISVKTQRIYDVIFSRKSGEAMPYDFEKEIEKQTSANYFQKQNISKDVIKFAMLIKCYDNYSDDEDYLEYLLDVTLLTKVEIQKAINLKNEMCKLSYFIFNKNSLK